MNYTEIQDLCILRKTTVSDVIRRIDMTYQGFRDALDKQSISANKVQALCKELRISPNVFFHWEKIDPVTYIDGNVQNGNHNVQNIMSTVDVLRDQLSAKDQQLAAKDQQIAKLFALLEAKQ